MRAILTVSIAALFLLAMGCLGFGQPTQQGVTTGAEWCKPGVYGAPTADVPTAGTVVGLEMHKGKQMCHMISTTTVQGMTITMDCYFDRVEMCCTTTGVPGVPATETCTPMRQ